MNFHPVRLNHEISEDGNYELRKAFLEGRGDFWNCWHVPSGKHVGASHQKKLAIMACIEHRRTIVAKHEEEAAA